jgi:hypothetical protein
MDALACLERQTIDPDGRLDFPFNDFRVGLDNVALRPADLSESE